MTSTENRSARSTLARVAFVAGLCITAFALLADPLTGGAPGIGRRQFVLLVFGTALALAGARGVPTIWARIREALAVRSDELVLTGGEIAMLAVTFACATAAAEGAVLWIGAWGFGEMHRLGLHVVWMSAVSNALVLGVAGAALWALGIAWRKSRTPPIVLFVFALLSVDAVIHRASAMQRVDAWSKWILAAGLAVAIARAMWSVLRNRRRALPRVAVTLAGVAAVFAGIAFAFTPVRERLAHARLGASAGGPNILLIILDTVRAANLGLYGYHRPTTPRLQELAGSSVVFDEAIAPSSWTLPSHATLFTGRPPNELSADWRSRLDGAYPTLAGVLSDHGYVTAAFSANGAYANANTGLERGFARFEDYPVTVDEGLRTTLMLRRAVQRLGFHDWLRDGYRGRKSAAVIGETFLDWQAVQPPDRPFFAFLNYFDAHDPYIAAPPFDTLFGGVDPRHELTWGKPPTAEVVNTWTDSYDRAISYIDHELGALFEVLQRRGVLDSTIVVITADHGEHFGERGFMRHGNTLYMPVLHVPLLVRYPPKLPAGVRVPDPVALRDVPATLLDLAGVNGAPLPGNSLVAAAQGAGGQRSLAFSEVREAVRVPARYPNTDADLWSVIAGDLHYIRSSKGAEELYRYRADRREERDLAGDAGAAGELQTLRQVLEAHRDTVDAALGVRDSTREP